MKHLKGRSSLVPLTLITALLVLSACSGKGGTPATAPANSASPNAAASSSTPGSDPKLSMEPITLKVFVAPSSKFIKDGIQDNAFGDAIKQKFGITLDIITGDDVKQKTMIAGGDLPDILVFVGSTYTLANSMIKSGQVIPLDDLIAKYGPNITKYSKTSLDVFRKSFSNNTNKVYFLSASQVKANNDLISQAAFVNFNTRWDLYKDAGYPEMKNEDDFLKVMKQIQDKNPTTKDGKKVYSFSAWTDWGTWPYIITYPFVNGYNNLANGQELNLKTGEVEDQYTKEDGIFWKGIYFYNKAYRMGLYDPEGFTQKSAQYLEKLNTGQLLNSHLSAWSGGADLVKYTGKDDAKLLTIPGPFPVISGLYNIETPLGWGIGIAKSITSHNKYPERTLQMLDYLNSPEGARLIYNGVKGKDWDIVNGKAQLIGEMAKPDNSDYTVANAIGSFKRLTAFEESYPSEDGTPVDLRKLVNPGLVSNAEKDFAKHYNKDFLYPGQVYDKLVKEGKFEAPTKFWPVPALVAQPSDATTQIFTKADQYFMANVAKFIMAKDDAEFDAAKKKAISDLKNLGIDKAYDELHQLLVDAQQTAKELNLK
jgi:putative aldouronate transport system substrate-binding protein